MIKAHHLALIAGLAALGGGGYFIHTQRAERAAQQAEHARLEAAARQQTTLATQQANAAINDASLRLHRLILDLTQSRASAIELGTRVTEDLRALDQRALALAPMPGAPTATDYAVRYTRAVQECEREAQRYINALAEHAAAITLEGRAKSAYEQDMRATYPTFNDVDTYLRRTQERSQSQARLAEAIINFAATFAQLADLIDTRPPSVNDPPPLQPDQLRGIARSIQPK